MSETPEKPKDSVAAAVVETWWDMKEQRDSWRSVAEQALAAIDYKGRDWLTEETPYNAIVVGCDRKKFLEALAAFDSLRKEEK